MERDYKSVKEFIKHKMLAAAPTGTVVKKMSSMLAFIVSLSIGRF